MYRTYELELAGSLLKVEVGRVAELAGGACVVRYGDTVVLCTATASEKPRTGIDFFPLSCDYEERLYAVGKIPGGFIKREGRPTENAVLSSRLIDRPIRPLFPDNMRNDVAVVATVWSVDQDHAPEVAAMIGANIALAISDIPFGGPVGSVNMGLVDGELIVNPDAQQRENSLLALTVSSTKNKVMMIEAGADEVPEDVMYKAIMRAHEENVRIVEFIESIAAIEAKPKREFEKIEIPAEIFDAVKDFVGDARMEAAVFFDQKQLRDAAVGQIKEEATEALAPKFADMEPEEAAKWINEAIYKFEKQTVRRMILKQSKRPDNRGLDKIRRLHSEVDVIPRVHGSAIFARGQTQVLTVTTLASMSNVQRLDGLDLGEEMKRYMHHYNFPSFSVGETRPSRGPGRREIGHGALAERALLPVLPPEEDFPYAIRLVSEVVSSNGSTSQASVCGSSLSLMAAGVPIKRAVAGISVGLITDDDGAGDYVLLTDIQGIEDFFGDMDFKVAGTTQGITAIQMDIKIDGLTPEIIKASLEQCRDSRIVILEESMNKAIDTHRPQISQYAPKIVMVQIDPDKMGEVIGPRGKVIHRIIEECGGEKLENGGITIDTMDDGKIYVVGYDMDNIQKAVDIINTIVLEPEVGKIYNGKVVRIMDFGAFVEIAPEKDGLVHISQLSMGRLDKVENAVKIGDMIDVKLMEIDDQGRLNFSHKATLPGVKPEDLVVKRPPRPSRPGGGRPPGGGDRGRKPEGRR
ncbi:MAG: polyribonucleotide nucleotidyltransferase [Clostridiales bacterium]|jgi:polyribonucleotide nucleotidyltransferase|nr:polyribonucleotide nucleotidyltransferase [Clostridiales bacterium]